MSAWQLGAWLVHLQTKCTKSLVMPNLAVQSRVEVPGQGGARGNVSPAQLQAFWAVVLAMRRF